MTQKIGVRPIFIFSLPRSGSTLLQRILAAHSQIDSVAEPWVLLPFLYPLRRKGIYSEYSHDGTYKALKDFIDELPNGKADYFEAVNCAVSQLYEKISRSDTAYFLDKTPRYSLICDEITQVFPNAKFIFLWRNPLSIISSMIMTSKKNVWNIYNYKVDLFAGMERINRTFSALGGGAYSVKYEDLCFDPEREVRHIFEYLDLEYSPEILSGFSEVKFRGRMGDPNGGKNYQHISREPERKWKLIINTPFRKWWCRKYLDWLGEKRLTTMGYSKENLELQLNRISVHWKNFIPDLFYALYGVIYCFMNFKYLKDNMKILPRLSWLWKHD